jgi:hypothetical protein
VTAAAVEDSGPAARTALCAGLAALTLVGAGELC